MWSCISEGYTGAIGSAAWVFWELSESVGREPGTCLYPAVIFTRRI